MLWYHFKHIWINTQHIWISYQTHPASCTPALMHLALAGGWPGVQVHGDWCFVLGALWTFGCKLPPAPILFPLSYLSITTFLRKDCKLGLVSCKLILHMAAIVPGQHFSFRCCHCKHANTHYHMYVKWCFQNLFPRQWRGFPISGIENAFWRCWHGNLFALHAPLLVRVVVVDQGN